MGDEYRYQSLPPVLETGTTPPFTRILSLAPGTGDEPLSGRLEILNLDAVSTSYEALSYTWGTDPPCDYLWLDGATLPLRPNLVAALIALRQPNQHRWLWIDALCISQKDVDERSRQVQYMRLVYKYAARVIVWIGLKEPGVEVAFEMAGRLTRIREEGEKPQQPGQQPNEAHLTTI